MKKAVFHEARWNEPIIMELGAPGERGILVPKTEAKVAAAAGPAASLIPEALKRKSAPRLPEISQMQLLRHYLRLSQETVGADLNADIGLGTCTMKYNPKIHEQFVRSPQFAELHPCQDEDTLQGILKIIYDTGEYLKAISGMDAFCLTPAGGSQAIYANVAVIRAWHESRGEGTQRDEIITTILSHPANPGAAATLGYKVITLTPGPDGTPDFEALRSAVSPRTAGLLITNPEDTGIYNERITEFVDLVHRAGGLCAYDQANANGTFGIARAREAGFDLCHFNLHKSFGSPHGCQGPAAGAQGAVKKLEPFLPLPRVAFDGKKYHLVGDAPLSVGYLRKFLGVPAVVLRAYAYIRSLGPDGLKQASELSILNNNYLIKKLLEIDGLELPWAPGKRRMEQARLSWRTLTDETGVTTDDIDRRVVDYGYQSYFSSHHPRVIPEPFTPEPAETYSKADIDGYAETMAAIAAEARSDPEIVKTAPHNAALASRIDESALNDENRLATTWRAWKKLNAAAPSEPS